MEDFGVVTEIVRGPLLSGQVSQLSLADPALEDVGHRGVGITVAVHAAEAEGASKPKMILEFGDDGSTTRDRGKEIRSCGRPRSTLLLRPVRPGC